MHGACCWCLDLELPSIPVHVVCLPWLMVNLVSGLRARKKGDEYRAKAAERERERTRKELVSSLSLLQLE